MIKYVIPKKIANGRVDIVGQKYGNVTVIESAGSEPVGIDKKTGKMKYKAVFKYLCNCGNTGITRGNTLRTGRLTSCGCEGIKRFSELGKSKRKHAHSGFSFIWHQYKSGAKSRGLIFTLSKKEFVDLTSGNCFYCGSSPNMKRKTRFKHAVYSYIYNGIDRVDNNEGYHIKNCVSCCGVCNKMKRDQDVDIFLDRCKTIALNSFKIKTILKNSYVK